MIGIGVGEGLSREYVRDIGIDIFIGWEVERGLENYIGIDGLRDLGLEIFLWDLGE